MMPATIIALMNALGGYAAKIESVDFWVDCLWKVSWVVDREKIQNFVFVLAADSNRAKKQFAAVVKNAENS